MISLRPSGRIPNVRPGPADAAPLGLDGPAEGIVRNLFVPAVDVFGGQRRDVPVVATVHPDELGAAPAGQAVPLVALARRPQRHAMALQDRSPHSRFQQSVGRRLGTGARPGLDAGKPGSQEVVQSHLLIGREGLDLCQQSPYPI